MTTTPSPWDRFGWVMSAFWLVFLGFPIYFVLQEPVVKQVLGSLIIAAFAAVYLYAFVVFGRINAGPMMQRIALIVLIGLMGALALVINIVALSLTPFIVAYAFYHRPFRQALWISGGLILVFVIAVTLADMWPELAFLGLSILLAALATGTPQWIDQRQEEYGDLQREYEVIAEREQMARDVHDVLGHSLTVITVKSELAERLLDSDPVAAAHELAQIQTLSRDALAQIRTTIAGQWHASLGEEISRGGAALKSAGIDLVVRDEPDQLDPQHQRVAAWVVREALTNVIRHSGASECTIDITPTRVTITDDGRGIEKGELGTGSGITGMRQRVEASGGKLHIGRLGDGVGTTLEVTW